MATLIAGINSLILKLDNPYRNDLLMVKVWLSATAGFTPNDGVNLAYSGNAFDIILSGTPQVEKLVALTPYYVKYAYISQSDPNTYEILSMPTAVAPNQVSGLIANGTGIGGFYNNTQIQVGDLSNNTAMIKITTGATGLDSGVGISIGGYTGRGIFTTGTPISGPALIANGYSTTGIWAKTTNDGGSWATGANAVKAESLHPSEATISSTKLTGASGAAGGYSVLSDSTNPLAESLYARSSNNGGSGHALRAINLNGGGGTNTSGLIGAANGYDFYADGQGTNYGPFTGTHDGLILKDTEVSLGDILVDVAVVKRNGISSTITKVEVSDSLNQKAVIGVVCALPKALTQTSIAAYVEGFNEVGTQIMSSQLETDAQIYNHVAINALGEGQINVCGLGGNLEPGDLLVSSTIPGKAQKQQDDLVRSYTVAKCRESVIFDYPEQIKLVACIYLCG